MSKNKWDPYVNINSREISEFFNEHFTDSRRKVLFILGKGFDVRMNITLEKLLSAVPNIDIRCLLIDYPESRESNSHKYSHLVDQNMTDLHNLVDKDKIDLKQISLFNESSNRKKWIGDKSASTIIKSYEEFEDYSDVIIDISALPRSVYSSLIGKVLSLSEQYKDSDSINLFVSVAENAEIDSLTKEVGADSDLNYLFGFGGEIELESEAEKPVIWFPLMGEDKGSHLKLAQQHIMQSHTRPYEVCPILPFPSKNLRRADSLIIEHHKWLFDEVLVDPKDIIYVPEQNPFEAYLKLNNAIKNYDKSLESLGGCKAVITNFSTKLLSIGIILSAFELKDSIGVGLLNVPSEGYELEDETKILNLKDSSEVFLAWLKGDPYQS